MRALFIDGHYYLYRSYFAIRGLQNSKGDPTNAIYGFAKAVRKMLADLKPELGAVFWDRGAPDHRMELLPEYKQQRGEMPDELKVQEPAVIEMCPFLGLASIMVDRTEADDLIASYTRAARERGMEVVIATNDKDILQLVEDGVAIYSTAKADVVDKKLGYCLLGEEAVTAKWGVHPRQIGDVLTLTGDVSDNIPGVPGVGGKTAAALIREHGSVEALVAALPSLKNERLREKLDAARGILERNRQMVQLQNALPLSVPVDALRVAPQYPELIRFLSKCEFKTLLAEVEREARGVTARVGEQIELFS